MESENAAEQQQAGTASPQITLTTPRPPQSKRKKRLVAADQSTSHKWVVESIQGGLFENVLSTKASAPASSIGHRHATPQATTRTPGPGAYQVPPPPRLPGARFVKPSGGNPIKECPPGPGSYSPLHPSCACNPGLGQVVPGYSIAPRIPPRPPRDPAPPPGTYTLPPCIGNKGSVMFTFSKGPREPKGYATCLQTPGPGFYPITKKKREGAGISLGIRVRKRSSALDTPGPGAYDLEARSLGHSKGKITMKVCSLGERAWLYLFNPFRDAFPRLKRSTDKGQRRRTTFVPTYRIASRKCDL